MSSGPEVHNTTHQSSEIDRGSGLVGRAHLLKRNRSSDEVSVNAESIRGPREPEDDAQKLSALELDAQLVDHEIIRLARVERTLAKIEAGTYRLSNVSGLPISA